MFRRTTFFTLIELLVVIAIIAILASMLMPALKAAREQAKTIACKNRQKQLMLVTINYADDYKGVIPFLAGTPEDANARWGGVYYYSGYLPQSQDAAFKMIQCPKDPQEFRSWSLDGYGMILPRVNDEYRLPSSDYKINVFRAKYPSRTPLFADSSQGTNNSTFYLYKAADAVEERYYYLRHSKQANLAFFDGHVEDLGANEIGSLPNFLNPNIKY